MPNIFVVPPEEEEKPAWCCAAVSRSRLLHSPRPKFLNTALNVIQHSDSFPPIFHRDLGVVHGNDVIMPRRADPWLPFDVLTNDEENHSPWNNKKVGNVRHADPNEGFVYILRRREGDRERAWR